MKINLQKYTIYIEKLNTNNYDHQPTFNILTTILVLYISL